MNSTKIDFNRLDLVRSVAISNLFLAISPTFIQRYPIGHTLDGDPIFQILYVLFAIPALAAGLNRHLAEHKLASHPKTFALGVASLAPLVFYLKWVITSSQVPFLTDSGSILLWLLLTAASVCLTAAFFGIPHLVGKQNR